jgi:hypothetical protein
MNTARVYLCTGNCETRFMNIAIENILYQTRINGKSPLLISLENPPFTSMPLKAKERGDTLPYFEYYTRAEIPSIQYSTLLSIINESRKRKALIAAEEKLTDIFIYYATSLPHETIYELSDELILFIKKDVSSTSWVYNIAKKLPEKKLERMIHIVSIDSKSLEESAILFYNLRNELYSLMGQNLKLSFGGFLNIEFDYTNAAISSGKTLIEFAPGGRFHGLITYILRSLNRNASQFEREEGFFTRLTSLVERNQ